jgi:hypothetical protein
VAARAALLFVRVGLRALEVEDRPRQVRERRQIAAVLELAAGHDRREAQALGAVVRPGPGHDCVERVAHVLEGRRAPVDARDAALDQQPGLEQLGEECPLLVGGGPELGHRG